MNDKEIQVINIWYSLREEYFKDKPGISLMEYVFHQVKIMVENKELDYEQFYSLMRNCTTNI